MVAPDYRPLPDTSNQHIERFAVGKTLCERHQDVAGATSLIFTHGVEAGMGSPKTRDFAQGFATVSPIVCFQGNRSLEARIRAFHKVVEHEASSSALGGRSMGARAAILTALEQKGNKQVALVLVSYPLYAGHDGHIREYERRERILLDLPASVDVLFIIGSEDPQGRLQDLAHIRMQLKARSWLVEVVGADHGMEIGSELGSRSMRIMSGVVAAEWLRKRDETKCYYRISWDGDASKVVVEDWRKEDD